MQNKLTLQYEMKKTKKKKVIIISIKSARRRKRRKNRINIKYLNEINV